MTASLRPYTDNDEPHPQVDTAFGFSIVRGPAFSDHYDGESAAIAIAL